MKNKIKKGNIMIFAVMSRQEAKNFSKYNIKHKTIIISITDMWSKPNNFYINPNLIDILPLQFDDVEKGELNCITKEDARKIISFVNRYINIAERIVVHCEAGISRSAGVCAALMKIITGDDSQIFNCPRFCPNRTCYTAVLNEYFDDIDDNQIEESFKNNIAIWKAANNI